MCGSCGAGGFRGDGLSTQQHPGVYVTVSVDLVIKETHDETLLQLKPINTENDKRFVHSHLSRLVGDSFGLGVNYRHLFGSRVTDVKILQSK